MSLHALNNASREDAEHLLRQCCTSEAWIAGVLAARPFASPAELIATVDRVWGQLAEEDYLQAFDGHPKIGDVNSLKAKYANTKALAAGEQASVAQANDDVIAALAEGNRDYEHKFGFIFIVCATGKSASEMLNLLQARLPNPREQELANAAEEQRKIFHLRLEKLL
ncbi:OHCU decarboxylase [Halioglobus japonicus]|uniref:2-oxo-4-hydroxy-4-carboxy-5-ureidoimidazoline decarboxylase n=1 Tax=Halioglobus japonicus TaxID=930805 RepID=A0AAP8MD81_9GAMM|nr:MULTISPECIES: 2-oxo-4-hydroxy-4-carboxy-5-ureidoimidazoline decarboxylase [Halioglobus]AQA17712.1 OHCU decarboxylase [Halioglobus japonicus]KZX57089.1 OHCU decarboxylase [Halioglobus sp. HI00S01]PLW85663.1 OHCU decarboxylase [Halioglobus japonicus]GHD16818.1 2-oxo-4-hydroxy-4-carboxy-5-ureidoimidazoline decarboxylase [Halioglobus japonicus]